MATILQFKRPAAIQLTRQEWQILEALHDGFRGLPLQQHLGLSQSALGSAVRRLFDKLGCGSRLELGLWYHQHVHRVDTLFVPPK